MATQDGRLLIFGQEGVEQTLPSPTPVATASLLFLPNKDSLLRITSVRPTALLPLTRPLQLAVSLQGWAGDAPALPDARGCLAQDGDVQLWSLTLGAVVDSLPCGDSALCVTLVDRHAPGSRSFHSSSHALPQSQATQDALCRTAWVLLGLESGALGALSTSTASGRLLHGPGNVGAVNMLPCEGARPAQPCRAAAAAAGRAEAPALG